MYLCPRIAKVLALRRVIRIAGWPKHVIMSLSFSQSVSCTCQSCCVSCIRQCTSNAVPLPDDFTMWVAGEVQILGPFRCAVIVVHMCRHASGPRSTGKDICCSSTLVHMQVTSWLQLVPRPTAMSCINALFVTKPYTCFLSRTKDAFCRYTKVCCLTHRCGYKIRR